MKVHLIRLAAVAATALSFGQLARGAEEPGARADGRFQVAQSDQQQQRRRGREEGQRRQQGGGGGGGGGQVQRGGGGNQGQRPPPQRVQRAEPPRQSAPPQRAVQQPQRPVQQPQSRWGAVNKKQPPNQPRIVEPKSPPAPKNPPRIGTPAGRISPQDAPRTTQPMRRPDTGQGGTQFGKSRPLPNDPGVPGFAGQQRPGGVPDGARRGPQGNAFTGPPGGGDNGRRFRRLGDIQKGRVVAPVTGGKGQIYREPGNRTIMMSGRRGFIQHNESQRFFGRPGGRALGFQRQVRPDGTTVASIRRRHGTVYSVFDREGRLIRRYRRGPGGREYVLIDNRRYWRRGVGIALGVGAIAAAAIMLAPVARAESYRGYAVDYNDASYDDLYYSLSAPPVEPLPRRYSLVEVLNSYSLRERMRRVEIDSVYFDSGSWEIDPSQYPKLRLLARALLKVIEENPDEVYLIEGHTDKEGQAADNLSLSDRRAEAVAEVLTEQFEVPPENLTTQGYGEEFPRINVEGAVRENRRVTVRRITPLLAQGEAAPGSENAPEGEPEPMPQDGPADGYAPDGGGPQGPY